MLLLEPNCADLPLSTREDINISARTVRLTNFIVHVIKQRLLLAQLCQRLISKHNYRLQPVHINSDGKTAVVRVGPPGYAREVW